MLMIPKKQVRGLALVQLPAPPQEQQQWRGQLVRALLVRELLVLAKLQVQQPRPTHQSQRVRHRLVQLRLHQH